MTIGDFVVSKRKEVEPFLQEVALMKQLILEHTHRLELLRELISNAGAQEVGATTIHITYFLHPQYGHTFEVSDNGCGMNFTNNPQIPGRLDRFLGLGLSAIAGLEADEFAWKGLGSKLAYQSRRIEIETNTGKEAYSVVVNEPWQTIEGGKKPRPQVSEVSPSDLAKGTNVRVYGHPPHVQREAFKFEEIFDYLAHRTFVGYTSERRDPPKITLTVLDRTEEIPLGFPEMRKLPSTPPEGTVILEPPIIKSKNLPSTSRNIQLVLKGFYTWDEDRYGLADVHLNTGLILSVKGIPYFTLNMRDLGSGQLAVASPGVEKCCLVVECDSIQTEMNISRSGLVDSPLTEHFRRLVGDAIREVEDSQRHRNFRLVPKRRKEKKSAEELHTRKEELDDSGQSWVFWKPPDKDKPVRLLREPENETDTLAILWKLEALGALPFAIFETLAYSGKGADLVVHFQEDGAANPERYVTMEVEHRFFNFKAHQHFIPQFPTVICWEVNPNTRLSVKPTAKPFKFIVQLEETTLRIYALKHIPGIFMATEEEWKRKNASATWSSNL